MSRLPIHSQRRWTRLGLFALVLFVSLGLGVTLLVSGEDAGDQVVGVSSLFVSVAALGVSLAQLFPPVAPPPDQEILEQLARTVEEQWTAETRARELRNPRLVPLAWSATPRPVGSPPENLVGPVDGRVLRVSLAGHLEGGFDEAARGLATEYRRVSSGRLVVLGEPGAGKTVLAIMLTLGMLAEREAQTPQVPVLLSVSSWDPVSDSLDDWIVTALATAYYGGRPEIPRRLVERNLLLPILDGMDEIPETARRSAVRAINDTCGDGRKVVVTCRSAEYEDVIEGGSPVLHRAPVIEVAPVAVPDIIDYLSEVSWPEGIDWDPVYEHLHAHPTGPLATALSTPLALSLARTVYLTCDRSPAELLNHDSRHTVEDHLVDHLIPAAYAPPPAGRGQQSEGLWRDHAAQAERWLTYLAIYLHRHRERDLAWWLMSRRLLSRWVGLVLGIGVGLPFMLAGAVTRGITGRSYDLDTGVYLGICASLLTTLAWYAAPDRSPGRMSFTVRGSVARLHRGLATGFRLCILGLLPVLIPFIVAYTDSATERGAPWLFGLAGAVAGGASAIALALAVHDWLDAPPEHSTDSSPLSLLSRDRAVSLVGSLASAVLLGACIGLFMCIGRTVSVVLSLLLTGWSHEPLPSEIFVKSFTQLDSLPLPQPWPFITVAMALSVIFFVSLLITHAWPKFALLRVVLAARGRLPWRLARFLAEARNKQLLRQSAGTYQFRHIRLQERLATRSLAHTRTRADQASLRGPLRTRAMVCTALLGCGLVLHQVLPRDTSRTTLFTGELSAMAFAPPERHTLVGLTADGEVRQWDTRTGDEYKDRRVTLHDAPGCEISPHSLTTRRDGILFGCFRRDANDVEFTKLHWDGSRQRPDSDSTKAFQNSAGGEVGLMALSPGGEYLAVIHYSDSAGDDVVQVTGGNRAVRQLKIPEVDSSDSIALSADGPRLAARDRHGYVILDRSKPHPVTRIPLEGIGPDFRETSQTGVAMNNSGDRIATMVNGTAQVWSAAGHKVGGPITAQAATDDVAMNADASMLATTNAEGYTQIWDL